MSTFETLEAERLDAAEKYDRTITDRSVLSARLDTIAKYRRALPILADIRRKTARLDELPDIASPPRTWTGSVADMIDDDASLRTRLSANVDEVDRVTTKIASVDVDEAILAMSERGSWTGGSQGAIHLGRFGPAQSQDGAANTRQRRGDLPCCLGRSSEPDPAALLLPAATVGAVRNMVEQRSGIATSVRVARDEARGGPRCASDGTRAGWGGKGRARARQGKA